MVPRVGNETLRPLGFGPCFGHKLQTKKLMMYSPGSPFIMVAPVVTSWAVAGQQMAFLHMYLQTRVTLKAFPVATPRGRSVSFPTRGTMVTYVTWDVFTRYRTKITVPPILTLEVDYIKRVNSYKHLGIWLDERLGFNIHIENILKKLIPKFGFLFHIKKCFPFEVKKNNYYPKLFPFSVVLWWCG